MTYGTQYFKNGKIKSYLIFNTGKKIILKHSEALEFKRKLYDIQNYYSKNRRKI